MCINATTKKILLDCLFIAAQHKMFCEAEKILKVLPIIIVDPDDQRVCEVLYYIVSGNVSYAKTLSQTLPPEVQCKLSCLIN